MAINKKLIHFKSKENFDNEVANGNILDTSICFILDTKEIWTHGNYYATQRTPEEIENIIASSKTIQAVIEQISSKVASELDSAIKKEIPTKNSQLENDSNFFVKETSGDGTKFLSDNGDYKDLEYLWHASKYNWVDLGLPSGLKWATCNIGAASPEEYGLYFAWGETQGYAECTDTKQFVEEDYALLDHLDYNNTPYYKKYDPNVDNLTTLELSDDAAYLSDNLCRMPTLEDFEELVNNTTGLWTYHGGVLGLRLTSKINHKSIFIPAAGSCTYGSVYGSNESVSLWSSSLDRARGGQMFAYSYGANKNWGTGGTTEAHRYAGLSIRPVLDSNKDTTLTPFETLSKINEINEKLEEVLYDSEITWQELKDLKDNSQLIPGRKYRMIDYETTTGAKNTLAAEHVFDLILTALDEKTLDEKCSAIQSERDVEGYFSNNNLSAWEVWYTIDNDTKYNLALLSRKSIDVDLEPIFPNTGVGIVSVVSLNETIESNNITYFKWGVVNIEGHELFILTTTDNPSVNDLAYLWIEGMESVETSLTASIINVKNNLKSGKGIIYRLIDEFRNDIPYDFKNIKFLRKVAPITYSTREITLDESGVEYYFYTFSHIDSETHVISDLSNTNPFNCCKNNVIQNSSWNNVFVGVLLFKGEYVCHNNFIGIDCLNNTFDFYCWDNKLGSRCSNNSFGNLNVGNILKEDCCNNIFEYNCSKITLNGKCNNNSFYYSFNISLQSSCNDNSFRISSGVTFSYSCSDNTIYEASNIVLGNSCGNNIIKGDRIKFGFNCSYNKISLFTNDISFKDNCSYNTLGSNCRYISFGDGVGSTKLGEFDVDIYAEHISIVSSYSSLNITASRQNGYSNSVRYYNISSFSKTAHFNLVLERNSKETTYVRIDSSDNITQFTDKDIYNKQDGLISGTNIKTINGESILGPGDITLNTSSINWSILGTQLITFTFEGVQYLAEEGMNFMLWCDSDYNTTKNTSSILMYNNSLNLVWKQILPNDTLMVGTIVDKNTVIVNNGIYG